MRGTRHGALAAIVAALYRGVDPMAAGTRGRVPLGRRNGGLRFEKLWTAIKQQWRQ